jgi:hypothetical protein
MRYVENLVTDERRVIWVFYPMEIDSTTQYAQFVNHVNDELKAGCLLGVLRSRFVINRP